MKHEHSRGIPNLATGAAAGLAGTLTLMALRSFDQRYAPSTVAKTREDPGAFLVKRAERYTGMASRVPRSAEKAAVMSVGLGYGILAGVAYSLIRGSTKKSPPLTEGILFGAIVYAVGYLGWLPLLGLTRPAWKESFPAIAGGLFRHVAFGITTSRVFGAINARR